MEAQAPGGCLPVLFAAIVVAALLLASAAAAAAGCGGFGQATGVTPNQSGAGGAYWVSVHLERGGWTSFASARAFGFGQRVWVWGCVTLPNYVEQPWVW